MAFKSSLFCPLQFKTLLVMLTTLHAASAEYYCDAHYLAGTAADAQPVLQACIDSTPSGDTLSIPPGVYSFESGLTISQAISVSSSLVSSMRCADDPTACATFQASPSFYSATGLLHIVGGVANVAIDHLIIDGNREMRLDSQSASECSNNINNRNAGRNAVMDGCTNCSLTNSVITSALCASGFIWVCQGGGCTIQNNHIWQNGDHVQQNMWADGITCLGCDDTVISSNYFAENSDIDLILGSGIGASLHDNIFSHASASNRPAFGAFMLDNFAGSTSGLFTGAVLENNNVDCDGGMCCFGIELGPKPWYQSSPIGGNFSVINNTVSGAGVGINVDAGGYVGDPITLHSNIIGNTQETFTCGALCGIEQRGSDINISPDSVVVIDSIGSAMVTSTTTYSCA